ncbi:MAG: DUF3794 domain-containing protein [Clostridia bacterium]|nr:DUF3794 domain-containing protein [Clostridia bacterium]
MSVKLQKENIRLSEVMCSPYCRTTVEGDVIVPDVKPDIQKILQVDSSVVINQKNVQNDKVYIQGTVRLNVLYLPDEAEEWSVKSILCNQEFNHTIDIKGIKPGMDMCVDAEIEPCEYTLVNSRKLNLRSRVGLLARLSTSREIELATGLEGGEPIEILANTMEIYNPRIDTVREMIVRERLEVPSGSPSICEVLKVSAKVCPTELRILDGRAAVSGELKVCTLYCGEGEKSAPEAMEHTLSFQESLEVDGLCEGMNGEIEYMVKDIVYEVCADSDGDRRILSCEVVICASLRAFESLECRVIEDAYGKTRSVELQKTPCRIEKMLGCETAQLSLNESVNIPDYLPCIRKLCECTGQATVESVSVSQNTVTVSGYITANFLYLSDDSSQPVSGFSHVLPFEKCFEFAGLTPDTVCDAHAEVEHIACTINGDKNLGVRAIIAVSIKAIAPYSANLVSDIAYCEDDCMPKCASIVVYFVQKGDTLWNIAKKYRTSVDAILSANGGDEAEIVKPGKCIYIFK